MNLSEQEVEGLLMIVPGKLEKDVQESTTGVPAPDWMESHKLLALLNNTQGTPQGEG